MEIKTEYYNLFAYANLLHIETFSAWDESVVESYREDIQRIAYKYYHTKPWAMIIDRRKWELHTPQAERLHSAYAVGKFKTPLSHVAVVVGHSEIKKWQVGKIVTDVKQFEFRLFDNMQDAKDWLANANYHMTPLE